MHDQTTPNGASPQAIELPNGVFPPMPGYTHEDLLAVVNEPVEAFLTSLKIDPGFIRETSIALVTHLWADLQRMGVEYQISTWYQTPYEHADTRARNISSMALHLGSFAGQSAYESLQGSPLMNAGDDLVDAFTDKAAWGIHDHIVRLNDERLVNPEELMGKQAALLREEYSDYVRTPFELTPNVLPPMAGYTLADLLGTALTALEAYMQKCSIERSLIDESLAAVESRLTKNFDRNAIPCFIAFYQLQPLADPAQRALNISELAETASGVAAEAAADALQDSPLQEQGDAFCCEFFETASDAIRQHILQLNGASANAQ
ncbi:MAG: hypothetical protein P0Y58_05770 [Candidatus Pseudomonas phytovorans]|uniref:Uncharacterized protein n=1 Tax=Candidatus Pseudomonas phytovorans TaxID=3121377 RepID=A0AAJ5WL94_9PSED|nr:hypothetical protein [Pseudomonas sp.]WEK31708.1 MAG: hypothetical protein P0Y58_05770 [Pseudomonas sp.]